MDSRRKLSRRRDIVSFGRRTPRFDFIALKGDVLAFSAEAPRERASVVDIRSAGALRPPGARLRR